MRDAIGALRGRGSPDTCMKGCRRPRKQALFLEPTRISTSKDDDDEDDADADVDDGDDDG